MRRTLTLCLVLACAGATLAAQDRSVWALVVNDVAKGDIEIALIDGIPWLDPASLTSAGIREVPEGERRAVVPGRVPWISLRSLDPLISYRLDEAEIRLLISADPSLLDTTEIAIANPRPPGWSVSRNAAMFLNYSADWTSRDTTAGYAELGVHVWGALASTAATIDRNGVVSPGLTSLTVDQVGSRRRWTVGDTVGRATTLGSSPVVGGFSVSTQPELDPYYTAYPSPQVRGAVRTPSIADVYVDGRLVQSVRLPPGQFTLADLPIESGLGQAHVVIRDAFGREQSIGLGYYLSTQLLRRGEQEYSYVAGKERMYSGAKVTYGRTLGTLFHSVGVANWLTVGIQGEAAKDLVMAGAGFQMRLWRLGVLGGEGLASQVAPKEKGYAATSVYSFASRYFSTDLRGTWIGPRFQNLYLEPSLRAMISADASASISLLRLGSLSLGGTLGSASAFSARLKQRIPDYLGRTFTLPPGFAKDALAREHDRAIRASYTLSLTSRVQLTATATRTQSQAKDKPVTWEGFGSVNVALGGRIMASSVTAVDTAGTARTSVHAQRSLPSGPGFGFRVDADTHAPYRSQATFEIQNRRGLLGVRTDGAEGQDPVTTVNVAGSIVAIGGELLLSRPVDDGFALVRVPNSKGVRVMANNQYSGRTGGRGTLFVPDLRSYLSTPISIEPDDLPLDMRLGEVRQNVAVPYRGGAVVTFEAEIIRVLVGRIETGGAAPAYGTLSLNVNGGRMESPLNATGEFYFESVPTGTYTASAMWQGRTCEAQLRMPDGKTTVNDVGAIRCIEVKQ